MSNITILSDYREKHGRYTDVLPPQTGNVCAFPSLDVRARFAAEVLAKSKSRHFIDVGDQVFCQWWGRMGVVQAITDADADAPLYTVLWEDGHCYDVRLCPTLLKIMPDGGDAA